MNDPLLGPRLKLERAYDHFFTLRDMEIDFFKNVQYRIIFDTHTKPGHKLVKIVIDESPPEIIHVLVGELIYQLRSALDQTAVAFAKLRRRGQI